MTEIGGRSVYYLEEALAHAMADEANKDPWQQAAIADIIAMARASRIAGMGEEEPLAPIPEHEYAVVRLENGARVKNYPMDLRVSFGAALKAWSAHRGFTRRSTLIEKTGISGDRLINLASEKRNRVVLDREVLDLAHAFNIPPGVLVTRRTPTHLFNGEKLSPAHEELKIPHIPFHLDRSQGMVLAKWGEFFDIDLPKLSRILELKESRFRSLTVGKPQVPHDLERMAGVMHSRFNVPPGLLYTRTLPEDAGIVLP